MDALGRFVAPVFLGGEATVVVATPQHRLDLARNLTVLGVDISAAARKRSDVALDAAGTLSRFTLEGWPDPVRLV
jgi:hypothetical protein